VSFERAGDLVANARDLLPIRIRGRSAADHGAAVAGAIADDNEWSRHVIL
jgi:hypothetical protein